MVAEVTAVQSDILFFPCKVSRSGDNLLFLFSSIYRLTVHNCLDRGSYLQNVVFLANIASFFNATSVSLRKLHLCFPCNYISHEYFFSFVLAMQLFNLCKIFK